MHIRRTLLLSLSAAGALVPAAAAATIPVTTTADVTAADGQCSLREAVFAARFDQAAQGCAAGSAGEDVIQLEAAEYRLAAGGAGEDGNESGDLDTGPTSRLLIVGRGIGSTTIGGAGDRVFDVFAGAALGLADLTVRDGAAPPGGSGGAVRNRGALTAVRVAFVNNAAGDGVTALAPDASPVDPGSGGAVWSSGQVQIADSVLSANRAGRGPDGITFEIGGARTTWGAGDGAPGGAVHIDAGSATFTGVTIVGSRAGAGGSALFVRSDDPSAGGDGGNGGAVAVTGGNATFVNATFADNRAGAGGPPLTGYRDESLPGDGGAVAALAPGSATVSFSTFAGNAAGLGAEGASGVGASVLGAAVGASILADASGACATSAPAPIVNVTLPGDASCPGARIAGDPRLGALAGNGGTTTTLLPGAGSIAIDAIANVPCPATDQRGLPRPALGACDAGAVEVQPGTPPAVGLPPGGGAGGGGTVVQGLRRISALTLGPSAFRVAGAGPIGTTVRFGLDAAGTVVLTVTRAAPGKRSGRRCVAPSRRLESARKCTRAITLPGSLRKAATAGANTLRFSGRLRGKALPPGAYTLVLTLPKAGSAGAVTARTGFRIIR